MHAAGETYRWVANRRPWRSVRSVAVAWALAVGSPAGAADEPSVTACLACHGAEVQTETGRALAAIADKPYAASAHGDLACVVCHTDASDLPHGTPPKPVPLDLCAACHGDAVDAYRTSVHGADRGAGIAEAPSCRDCHGDLHAVRPKDDPESAAHWTRVAVQCARCHANRALVEKFRIPIVRPVEAYLQSAHARAVASGTRAATCVDCHEAHAIRRSDDPESSISRRKLPETCGTCHAEVLALYRESVHGIALERGVSDAPVCSDCHGEHRILGTAEPASPVFAANITGETCGRCHANARMNEKYGLPAGNVAAFTDSFHGMALRGGKLTVANCSSCHGVHDIRPSSDPRSHVHPANLSATCGKCHPGASANLRLGPVHASSTTEAGAVSWIRFVYLWLIGITVGGMVLHNLTDLARKARTPLPSPPSVPEVPPRMPRALRVQHGLVMASFPVLVYTGFALTYPEHWWAVPLLRWETALGLRGILHRAAALLMMGAVVWHAAHVAASPTLRACLRSALPARADVRLFGETLAYWAGRRPHPPHAGTWHYAEKVEYWAFLWGAALMSATGVVLWSNDLALRWLPGWVLEVATALHFYEAVLASLAILVWHLYWVVFDPAVYPMDWTWWTGNAPPRRVQERLPDPDSPPGDEGS
jgi:cytochrome b subunit of formate dehydrogenase